jgi:hypothetical protein
MEQGSESPMNRAQARHAKAMARKIKTHAEGMALSMGAIEWEKLEDVPLEIVKERFGELGGYWRSIQSVLKDMLPELDDQ